MIGLYTNYLGFTPFPYKVDLERTLFHRAHLLCSFLKEKLLHLVLPIMVSSTINYLILVIFQLMLGVGLISFANFILRFSILINAILTPFKVGDIFNLKVPIPKSLTPYLLYKFVCLCCNAYYIGETTRHLIARIKKHLKMDKKSHSCLFC